MNSFRQVAISFRGTHVLPTSWVSVMRPENGDAGTIVLGTNAPDDGVHLCQGQGIATLIAPLGNKRHARTSSMRQGKGVPDFSRLVERRGSTKSR